MREREVERETAAGGTEIRIQVTAGASEERKMGERAAKKMNEGKSVFIISLTRHFEESVCFCKLMNHASWSCVSQVENACCCSMTPFFTMVTGPQAGVRATCRDCFVKLCNVQCIW
jgi:hypothetical protein